MRLPPHVYQRLIVLVLYIPPEMPKAAAPLTIVLPIDNVGSVTIANFTPEEMEIFWALYDIYEKLQEMSDIIWQEKSDLSLNARVLSPEDELTEKFKQQEYFSEHTITEKTFGFFNSYRETAIFICRFEPIATLYKLAQMLQRHMSEYPFMTEILLHLRCIFIDGKRKSSPALSLTIQSLWGLLTKLEKEKDISPDDFVSVGIDLGVAYREMQLQKKWNAPSEKELSRRKKISKSKQEKNNSRRLEIAKIIKEIKKKQVKEFVIKNICRDFFKEHKIRLEALNIQSSRTLENLYSRQVSRHSSNRARAKNNSLNSSLPIDDSRLKKMIKEYSQKKI